MSYASSPCPDTCCQGKAEMISIAGRRLHDWVWYMRCSCCGRYYDLVQKNEVDALYVWNEGVKEELQGAFD